jgi:hypothetical protein
MYPVLKFQKIAVAGAAGSTGAAETHADSFLIGHCSKTATASDSWAPNPGATTSTCQGMNLFFIFR